MAHESLGVQVRRVHLTTVVVLTVAAVALLWANLRVSSAVDQLNLAPARAVPELDPVTRYMFFRGWPLSPFEMCPIHGMRFHPEEGPVRLALVLDFLVAGLLLLGLAALSEWLVRQFRQGSRHPPPATAGCEAPGAT